MKRTLIALISYLALASSASALSLSLVPVGPTTGLSPGANVTFNLVADIELGVLASAAEVRLVTSNSSVLSWTPNTVNQAGINGYQDFGTFYVPANWTVNPVICPAANPAECIVVNQVNANIVTPNPTGFVPGAGATPPAAQGSFPIAQIQAVAGGPGNSTISVVVPANTLFQGLGGSAGTVLVNVVPEPGTLLLLGFGLGGLALVGRRQS